jgi:hypothetical protein
MLRENDVMPQVRVSQKVSKLILVADEVVVAKLPKRVPQKYGTSEGLQQMSS